MKQYFLLQVIFNCTKQAILQRVNTRPKFHSQYSVSGFHMLACIREKTSN